MLCGLLLLGGLVCGADGAPAVVLTPKNIAEQPHLLYVGVEKKGEEMRVTVLVRLKGGKAKPIVDGAYLHINDGKTFVARTAVPSYPHPEAQRNIMLFEFSVGPKYLENSTFSFGVATLDEKELKNAGPGRGWRHYSFTLKDFPSPGAPDFGVYPRDEK